LPFVARCRCCNYLIWCKTKALLKEFMDLHNDVSHQYLLDDDDFTVMRINDEQLKILDVNAHNKAFWEAFNKSRKLIFP
jgi:hypothetical protein